MNNSLQGMTRRTQGFPFRFGAVLTCFSFTLFFLLFQGGKLAFMLFIIMSLISVYLVLGRWSGIRDTQGERRLVLPDRDTVLEAGSSVTVRIDIQIPGFWPIPYVIIKDKLVRRNGGSQQFECSVVPDWSRKGAVEYRTPPLRRGVYGFEQTECSTQDMFGIFEHRGVLAMPTGFKVLPHTVAIREWQQLHRMHKGTHQHAVTTRAVRETTQLNGVREYNYGDRLSRIHWNATAKTGTLKSKEFERESLPRTIVLLDRAASSYGNEQLFEVAVSAAASLLEYGGRKELAIGLMADGYYEPGSSRMARRQMLNHLVEVEADGSKPLLQVLTERTRELPTGTFITIVSADNGEAMLRALGWLKQRQLNPCHVWVNGEHPEAGERWLLTLRHRGISGYAVRSLEELPAVLEGRGL
ncbi:hypothetical protein J31TS4_28240 [Paenibacillus sp. J31TS4]|uniref:DUF58 domain-containing protein n=1 Tax=Paenibacillus sp. J31TS4 TaxID=2807195 RepID=UPI001B031673|nr:DUF58 domain-containing protein [Paenibacillus sp. J31TS4]GIP39544.1 hypothetical protein J31TS4_28240 [Paenibacillus sp. J31TS4]